MKATKTVISFMTSLSFCSVLLLTGCGKDKNMDDYNRDQNEQNIARIESISGSFTGAVVSKIDGKSLGEMSLTYKARTSGSGGDASKQATLISGSVNIQGLESSEVAFDNGSYDEQASGDNFHVTIGEGTTTKISLNGRIIDNHWVGTIEVTGQSAYGATLNLLKNAPQSSAQAIEVSGTRLEQIKRGNITYSDIYKYNNKNLQVSMNFINKTITAEQTLVKLLSPVRLVDVSLDFSIVKFKFSNVTLDDKIEHGTLKSNDDVAIDDSGVPAAAKLECQKFDDGSDHFGWQCVVSFQSKIYNLHLTAAK